MLQQQGIRLEESLKNGIAKNDDYDKIMLKILADRLAEAYTELLHEDIRKKHWGYAKEEKLSVEEMLREKYRGIRPAFGYPSLPDHSEKEVLWKLLNAEETIGTSLTENYAMYPAASVSGLIFAHPEALYFSIDRIKEDQLRNYAERKGIETEKAERLVSSIL